MNRPGGVDRERAAVIGREYVHESPDFGLRRGAVHAHRRHDAAGFDLHTLGGFALEARDHAAIARGGEEKKDNADHDQKEQEQMGRDAQSARLN